jgi:DNA-directed RNA polymerase subunit RPC12/RpoP
MDEQGIYCPQCRAYVHFWLIPSGGRPPAAGEKRLAPGISQDMPQACRQCGYKSTYKTTDLRTRRVPTEPVNAVLLGNAVRAPTTIDAQSAPNKKGPT